MSVPLEAIGQALESAVVADPDDLAAHMAFSDWLSEQAAPRLRTWGELIRVQLALEDDKLKRKQRKELAAREKELIQAHERDGVDGELRTLLQEGRSSWKWSHARGWISKFTVSPSPPLARAIAQARCLRLLRELEVDASSLDPDDASALVSCFADSPHLGNLRVLYLSIWQIDSRLDDFIARLPRLEELDLSGMDVSFGRTFTLPLPNLKELRFGIMSSIPVADLVANPTLTRLQCLSICPTALEPGTSTGIGVAEIRAIARCPHFRNLMYLTVNRSDMGDEGIRELVASGILGRLQSLDLSMGCVTDAGARMLADCREARGLYALDLRRNRLTDEGIELLLEKLPRAETDDQQEPDEDGDYDDRYLFDDFLE